MSEAARFTLMIDPSSIGTAQQRRFGISGGKIRTYADPKVARGMRIVSFLARNAMRKAKVELPKPQSPASLKLVFRYAIPKSRRNRTVGGHPPPHEGDPCNAHWAGDCDNKTKSVQDALVNAGCFANDKDVTHLDVRKVWTSGSPRIDVEIAYDETIGLGDGADRLTNGVNIGRTSNG